MFSSLVVLLGVLASQAHAAGFTSHNTFARRTSQYEYFGPATENYEPKNFYGLALDRYDAIQGGAPFPDYLYTCGDDHNAGEEAHWTPFQIAAANYIREKYPDWATQSRTEDGPGLVAFMMGVTSHYITDMNWHGLETVPAGEGIIRNVGFADFNCTNGDLCSIAHSAVDTGGEFTDGNAVDLSWYPARNWFIPATDLVNVYAALGIQVQEQWINECAVIFYAGSWAVSTFGDIIYDLVMAERIGGLLIENYVDFPVGGVDDNAAWTGFMWNRFAQWVSEGPPETYPNRLLRGNKPEKRTQRKLAQRKFSQAIRNVLTEQGVLPLKMNKKENSIQEEGMSSLFTLTKHADSRASFVGLRTKSSTKSTDNQKVEEMSDSKELIAQMESDRVLLLELSKAMIEEYALSMGNEIEEVTQHIALSSEVREELLSRLAERIDLMLKYEYGFEIKPPASKIIEEPVELTGVTASVVGTGNIPREYFSSAVRAVDLTGSGKSCDLLVGSYGAGRTGGPQEGIARAYYGAACNLDSSPLADVASLAMRGGVFVSDGVAGYERFGYAVDSLDFDQDGKPDIISCAPSFGGRNVAAAVGNYSGRCDIFLNPLAISSSSSLDPSDSNYVAPVPSISIYGDSNWGLFGSKIHLGDLDKDGLPDLIVSAPAAGSYPDLASNEKGETSSQGAVYVYFSSNFKNTFAQASTETGTLSLLSRSSADVTLQLTKEYSWLGRSIQVAGSLLLVGAPISKSSQPGEENSAVGTVYAFDFSNVDIKNIIEEKNKRVSNKGMRGIKSGKTLDYSWSLSGCRHAGRTGHSFAYSPDTGLLAISEPSYNTTYSTRIKGVKKVEREILRSGRVLLFSLSALNSQGHVQRDMRTCETEWAKSGSFTVVQAAKPSRDGRFGSSLAFRRSTNPNALVDLIVSSPLADNGGGRVTGLSIASSARGVLSFSENWVVSGSDVGEPKGRLGSVIELLPSGAVLASSPYADAGGVAPDGDMTGALFILTPSA